MITVSKYLTPSELYITGIYFLLSGDRIIYIGQSINIFNRMFTHHIINKTDRIRFIRCNKKRLNEYEMRWIRKFRPKFNSMGLKPDKPIVLRDRPKSNAGRKRLFAPEKLGIGARMKLPKRIYQYRYQYLSNFNCRGEGKKYQIVMEKEKIFIERVA